MEYILKKIKEISTNKKNYVFTSGLTPSGPLHIGSVLEIGLQFLSKKIFEEKYNKKVKTICIIDDMDPLKKIPEEFKNVLTSDNLFKPINQVYINQNESLADYYSKKIKEYINNFLHLSIFFIFSSELYSKRIYPSKRILKDFLDKKEAIVSLQEEFSFQKENVFFSSVYSILCTNCRKYNFKNSTFSEERNKIFFSCKHCSFQNIQKISLRIGKFKWRYCLAIRWMHLQSDLEFAGKDHLSKTGTFYFSKKLCELVFKKSAPVFGQYEFFITPGLEKISKSKKNEYNVLDILPKEFVLLYVFSLSIESSKEERPENIFNFLDKLNILFNPEIDKNTKIRLCGEQMYSLCPHIVQLYALSPVFIKKINFKEFFSISSLFTRSEDILIYFDQNFSIKEREFVNLYLSAIANWNKQQKEENKIDQYSKIRSKKLDLRKICFSALSKIVIKELYLSLKNKEWVYGILKNDIFWKLNSYNLPKKEKINQKMYLLLIGQDHGIRLDKLIFFLGKEYVLDKLFSVIDEN